MDGDKDRKEKSTRSPIHKSLLEAVSEIKIGEEEYDSISDEYDFSDSEGFISEDEHIEEIITGRSLKELLNVGLSDQDDQDEHEKFATAVLQSRKERTEDSSFISDSFTGKSISDVYLSIKNELEEEMAQKADDVPIPSRNILVTEFCTDLRHVLIGKRLGSMDMADYLDKLDQMKLEDFPEWTRGALIRSINILNSN